MESLLELRDLVLTWEFISVGFLIVFLAVVGSGLWKIRWSRTACVLAAAAVVAAFAVGIQRHELGEVLFNGQLL